MYMNIYIHIYIYMYIYMCIYIDICECRHSKWDREGHGVCVCVRGWWGLTYIHPSCTCCWSGWTCVCVCLGGGERQHLTFAAGLA